MGNNALLVIDMLNDFILEGAPLEVPTARRIIPQLRRQLLRARRVKVTVVFLCDSHDVNDIEFRRMGWPPHAIAGSKGAQIIDELAPSPQDKIIHKRSYSGFFETELDPFLKERNILNITVTGCVTNICVLYTVADAVQRGYEVTVIESCVAALKPQHHEFALQQMKEVLGARIV